MKTSLLLLTFALASCATMTSTKSAPVDARLQLSSAPGHLKAKLVLKNLSQSQLVLNRLSSGNFRVEMLDGDRGNVRCYYVWGTVALSLLAMVAGVLLALKF